ncbi:MULTISPECIES: MerR family transcriptional regulator [unclassified Streptomyces]|uniref:MerR family transcriptional regulator n=1 Tax=unclassified Streptomyces TaxID=2593676 RepID=UPI00136A376F|nr:MULTISPECIES: MerR family transcriptional regulator [unclassified Streptomyces]NEA01090.1 MerR family transcriptional regulator [Streptomyces sp. SID10116]MYY81895.1 MerR family transcriptional regulator [Streptomyces sp. SID335]MYZ17165.1 MerR family transcriptional regulator [Streptomyces sp. SID337]NDZ85030.1 MerR family transcriptional regulator [Streptomyces sp. SID10115]NEB47893.1 MerR family transcriptional regulator [Streptomyces sp. SID339]
MPADDEPRSDDLWSIGQLAERAGVTVKTVRFYSDRGLLPEAARSGGGHRRYGPDALDRLRLIRSLRTLDLPVPDVRRVLDEEGQDDVLEDVIAGQLKEVGSRLAALRWREAALQLLADRTTPQERAERLRLVGAVSTPPGTAALARFWRCWLPARLPSRVVAAVVDRAVPVPPDTPAPAQVLAFARLQDFVTSPCFVAGPRAGTDYGQPEVHASGKGYRPAVLYEGLPEAFELAAPDVRAGRAPREGEALDCFVAVHAAALNRRDTPDFRRTLHRMLAAEPRIDRYWQLAAEVVTPPAGTAQPTPGSTDNWLRAALGATAPQ